MPLPLLTSEHVNEVLNMFDEVQIGQVIISDHNINHRITYSIKNNVYKVYRNNSVVATRSYQQNALDFYNDMNKKVDHLP